MNTADSTRATEADPVVVVGAGIAGLHAAWRIHQAGFDVIVLEARDRVGGRTWSQALSDGTVIERGGEFIAPDHDAVRGLASELGLELVPHGFDFDRRPTPDRDAPSREDIVAATDWLHALTQGLLDDVAAADVLPAQSQWPAAVAKVLPRLATSLAVPLSKASALRTFTSSKHAYDPAVRIRDGNQAIAQALARRLGDRVVLETPVVAVRSSDLETCVVTERDEVRAAAVVLALPLPLLLDLHLQPGLPTEVRRAAAQTQFSDAAKLHVPLSERPVPGRIAMGSQLWWCWTSQISYQDPAAAPVLSCFAAGGPAISSMTADAALALRPDVSARAEQPVRTHWADERWTRGAYSGAGVGLTYDDDSAWTRLWGPIVFAGEHTAGDLSGTINGAAASGARAAKAVTEILTGRQTSAVPGL